MDRGAFLDTAPGRLVPIDQREFAFVPHPLPPAIELSDDQHVLLATAREVIGEVRGITTAELLPNSGLLLRALQREESLRSSSIEGIYVTAEELLKYELRKEQPNSDPDGPGAWREAYNADAALRIGQKALGESDLSCWLIRSLHQALLEGVRGEDKSPGEFRTGQVYIGSDGRFIPPPGYLVQQCMDELEKYCTRPSPLDPVIRAALIHYQFETIHPFRDGNGRVGRVLLALQLAKWCDLGQPWIYLSAFFEEYKDEYISGLFDVSAKNDWLGWINFCLRATIREGRETIRRCKALLTLRSRWLELVHERRLHRRNIQIVEHLMGTPIIDTVTAQRVGGVASPVTARSDLDKLVKLGILRPVDDSKRIVYLASEILQIVHRRN